MSFAQVREAGLEHLEDEEDLVKDEDLPKGITRISDWKSVVDWVETNVNL